MIIISNNIIKKELVFFILVIYFFLYLFLPPICSISTIKLLDIATIFVLCIFFTLKKNILDLNLIKPFLGYIPFFVYFYIIMFIQLFFMDLSYEVFKQSIRNMSSTIINLIIVILFIKVLLKLNLLTFKKFIKIIAIVGFIEFICVLLSLVSPEIKSFFNSLTINYSTNEFIANATLKETFRAFGFADNLFDSFGYRLSLIIVLLFIEGLFNKKPKLLYFSFVFLFMPMINARTGLVLSFCGMILASIYYVLNGFKINYKKVSIVMIIIAISIYFIYTNLSERTQYYLEWGLKVTMTLLFEQKTEGVYSQILDKDLVIPDNYLIGVGGTPDSFDQNGLDNGYIKLCWYFGIIGILLYFFGFIYFWYFTCRKYHFYKMKCLAICYFCIYSIYMIKLSPIFFSSANFLLFAVPFILQNEYQEKFSTRSSLT